MLQGLLLWGIAVTVPQTCLADVLNASRDKRIKIRIYSKADGIASFLVSKTGWRALTLALPNLEEVAQAGGSRLEALRAWCLHRMGLLLGAVMAIFILLLLGGCVWDIRIDGNEKMTDTQVLAMLRDSGLEIGNAFSGLNPKAIARDVCLATRDLSYVSINRRGTVVYVHVMERDAPDDSDGANGCSNLVAAADGVIEDLAVRQGTILVHRGQVVKKGDLLVSGMRQGHSGTQLFHAEGEVYGRVERRLEIVLPRKMRTNPEKMRRTIGFSYVFWGKTINIFTNTGNLPSTYDTIYEKEQLYIGDDLRLPFYTLKTVALTYEQVETVLDDDALVALANRRMEAELQSALKDGELLCKKMHGYFTEETYVLVCEYSCLENIAESKEFEAR